MLFIPLNINYFQNFINYKARFALFNDIKIMKFGLLFIECINIQISILKSY